VRILLDENMPRKLLAALTAEGHEVESVKSLQLVGIDNGALYELAEQDYDLCFTRDAEFAKRVRRPKPAARLKLVHVVIPQAPQDEFVRQFVAAFRKTDWADHANGDDWPLEAHER
jgi:predicted nuclease of predicted toxin-antitoxin system